MPGGDGTGPQGKGPRTGRRGGGGGMGSGQGGGKGAGQGRAPAGIPGKKIIPPAKTQDNSDTD